MQSYDVSMLLSTLAAHPDLQIRKGELEEPLHKLDIPESGRFCFHIPNGITVQSTKVGDTYYALTLKQVLRTKVARNYRGSAAWRARAFFESWSDSDLVYELRFNPTISDVVASATREFSMLGEYIKYGNRNREDRPLVGVVRPVLLVPGTENLAAVLTWEKENETCAKWAHEGFFKPSGRREPISREEYFALISPTTHQAQSRRLHTSSDLLEV